MSVCVFLDLLQLLQLLSSDQKELFMLLTSLVVSPVVVTQCTISEHGHSSSGVMN